MPKKCWICGRTEDEVTNTKYYSTLEEQFISSPGEIKPSQLFFKRFHPAEDPDIAICSICLEILKEIISDSMEKHKLDFHSRLDF